jgi:phosphatidate cytidylyltransferase
MSNPTAAAPTGKWADLALRSASAVVLMPVALYCVWQGGIWFQMFLGVLAVLMAHEWVAIVHGGNVRSLALHVLAGLSGVFVTAAQGLDAACAAILMVWLLSVLQWVMNAGTSSVWSLFGVFYIGLPMMAFVLLREDASLGLWAVLWCFLIVWAADICAYFAGRTIGGPKLAPRLSPKKTWAGLLGGMAGAGLVSVIFGWALGLNVSMLLLLACVLTLVEQAGDILESALKRSYGVKDSGNFIPGHGGVLDRVDGLIAVVFASAVIGFAHQAGNAAPGLLHW